MLVSIFLVFLLIVLNAIFAASEAALVAINHNRLADDIEKGNKKAIKVKRFVDNPTNFLSTIQVGITFIGFINAIILSDTFSDAIVNYIASSLQASPNIIKPIVTIILTLVLTYFQVVLGELVPKRIAMRAPRQVSYAFIGLNSSLSVLMRPIVWLLTASANIIIKIIGIKVDEREDRFSEEEILLMVTAGRRSGSIDDVESEMIQNIFEFDDTTVEEIMTHRTEISAVDINTSKHEIVKLVISEGFTRFPVYEDNIDNIIGTIHSKDLLKYLDSNENTNNGDGFKLSKILRKPYYIPVSKIVSELFIEMKNTKNHISIVIDEYGGTAGIVTLEDIIEEIVGNIFDEYDDINLEIIDLGNNEYEIDGQTNLDDVMEVLEIDFPIDEYDTISGFVIGLLGRLPENDDLGLELIYLNYSFKLIEIGNKVINRVKAVKIAEAIIKDENGNDNLDILE